jgi:Leucine-rich repeat (LRR) protein
MRFLIFFIFFGILACTSKYKTTVSTIDLSNKNLLTIPDSIFSFEQLEYLELGNSVTLYPPLTALGNDTAVNMNKITAVPHNIIRLQNLRKLGLGCNNLISLPIEITQLENLDTLDISFNQHLNIRAALGILKQMQWLKYLNIIATNADNNTIDELRKSLPNTLIVATPKDIFIDTNEKPR